MAANIRTIRVTGLPVDVPENRLADKIQIHFLRKKNGGGDILSVSVSKTMPGSALVTFEEPEVALRLVQRGDQVLKVNDRSYNVSVRLHQEELDPDEVLLEMSVMVDLTKLPDGKQTLLSLQKTFPGIHLTFDHQKGLCAVKGLYSEVQALSGLMLGSLPTQTQSKADAPPLRPKNKEKQYIPLESSANRNLLEEELGGSKHAPASKGWDLPLESWKSGLAQSQSYSHQASHQVLKQDDWDSSSHSSASIEDFSLIVDSDIFRYLHKYCAKEYESILMQNGVEVLEVNCGDIMTLYFKPNRVPSESGLSFVRKAHQDLALLYQEKESQLRKEHVSKREIPQNYLEHALESLRERLPMLMMDEDAENVYMVGCKRDVSEAKQFIVEVKGAGVDFSDPFASGQSKFTFSKQGSSASSEQWDVFREQGKQYDDADDLFELRKNFQKTTFSDLKAIEHDDMDKYRPYSLFAPSTSSTALDLDKKPFEKPDFLSEDTQENGSEKQKSTRGYKTKPGEPVRERKMAANFSSGLKDVGDSKIAQEKTKTAHKVKEDTWSHSLPYIIPPVNINLNPNTLHGSVGSKPKTSSSKTDVQDDMKRFGQKPSILTEKMPGSLTGHSGESQTFSLGHMDRSDDLGNRMNPSMPLRRSNSFSGRNKSSQDHLTDLGRRCRTMDLAVPCTLWLYLRSVYKTEIETLTSDLQLKERYSNTDITLYLSGSDWEKLDKCHHGLKSLIDKVSLDFDAKTLSLSKFGIPDSKDQTLANFCTMMKQSYDRVNIIIMPENLMILGPKLVCEKVEESMMEMFHTESKSYDPTQSDTVTVHQDPSKISDPTGAHVLKKVPQSMTDQTRDTTLDIINKEQDNQSGSQKKKELSMKPDLGEGGKKGASEFKADSKTDGETSITDTLHSQSDPQNKPTVHDQANPSTDFSGPCGVQLPNLNQPSKASGTQDLLLCQVCQKKDNTVKQRGCGYNFCSQCKKEVHTACKTCLQEPNRGIRGTMTIRELVLTISGYYRDTTLKIIYDIPDGIQGDGHPCPGAPFKGRTFEAFLPNNEATNRLLPLLEKAFHKGLTFTVKAGSSEEGSKEGTVVWGSIPHKTSLDGGASKNGYPDSGYIKRLTEALKAMEAEQ